MKKSKTDIKKEIEEFFRNIKDKSPKEIKKIKKSAMSFNIRLGDLKKKFCEKCYTPYIPSSIETRIKDNKKVIKCKVCGHINRWKIKKN